MSAGFSPKDAIDWVAASLAAIRFTREFGYVELDLVGVTRSPAQLRPKRRGCAKQAMAERAIWRARRPGTKILLGRTSFLELGRDGTPDCAPAVEG